MADEKANAEEAPAAAPAAGGGGAKSWLPLIITVLLMPALAFGMTEFVLLPQLQKGLGVHGGSSGGGEGTKAKKSAADPKAATEQVVMNKLLVNVSGTMGARYLLVSLSVVGTGTDFKEMMNSHDAQLRDMACGALSMKTLADLEKPNARNLIRSELLTGFNNILGDSTVQDIYLTEFAIQ
jgi:flagellar FliL protein